MLGLRSRSRFDNNSVRLNIGVIARIYGRQKETFVKHLWHKRDGRLAELLWNNAPLSR